MEPIPPMPPMTDVFVRFSGLKIVLNQWVGDQVFQVGDRLVMSKERLQALMKSIMNGDRPVTCADCGIQRMEYANKREPCPVCKCVEVKS